MARTKRVTPPATTDVEQPAMSSADTALLHQLEEQRSTLETRLRHGEEIIATRRAHGEAVNRLESGWLALLNQYEQVSLEIEQVLEQARLQPAA